MIQPLPPNYTELTPAERLLLISLAWRKRLQGLIESSPDESNSSPENQTQEPQPPTKSLRGSRRRSKNEQPTCPTESESRPAESAHRDIGLAAIDLIASMTIEDAVIDRKWTIREPRSFTWWSHRLSHTIWADEPHHWNGMEGVNLHAETVILRDVPMNEANLTWIGVLNDHPSLYSFILDEERGLLVCRSKAHVWEQNLDWVSRLFFTSLLLQAEEANDGLKFWAKELGGEAVLSVHPQLGRRRKADSMLEAAILLSDFAQGPSPVGKEVFQQIKMMSQAYSVLSNSDENGVTAEFPFGGEHPLIPGAPRTTLFRARSTESSYRFGKGCLFQLKLPVFGLLERLANALNHAESESNTQNHFLGSWHVEAVSTDVGHVLLFSTFLPSALCDPDILINLFLSFVARHQWAKSILVESSE